MAGMDIGSIQSIGMSIGSIQPVVTRPASPLQIKVGHPLENNVIFFGYVKDDDTFLDIITGTVGTEANPTNITYPVDSVQGKALTCVDTGNINMGDMAWWGGQAEITILVYQQGNVADVSSTARLLRKGGAGVDAGQLERQSNENFNARLGAGGLGEVLSAIGNQGWTRAVLMGERYDGVELQAMWEDVVDGTPTALTGLTNDTTQDITVGGSGGANTGSDASIWYVLALDTSISDTDRDNLLLDKWSIVETQPTVTVPVFFRPDANSGGDGQNNTTSSGDGSHAYSRITDAIVGEVAANPNLVSLNRITQFTCTVAGTETASANIDFNGFTEDKDHFPTISLQDDALHNGVFGAGYNFSGSNTNLVRLNSDFVRWNEFQVTSANSNIFIWNATPGAETDQQFTNTLIRYTSGSSGNFAIDPANTYKVTFNNLIVSGLIRGIDSRDLLCVINHAVFDGDGSFGILGDDSSTITNVVSMGYGDDFINSGGSMVGNNNASVDTTAETLFPTNSINSIIRADEFTDPDSPALDYTLKVGSQLIGAGTDSSDMGYIFPAVVAFTLEADTGTYTYTGTDVVLPRGPFTLTADSGAYTYTGTAVDFLSGVNLNADAGAYSYLGSDVGLFHSFTLDAETGTYTYTGTTVNLQHSQILTAELGTYTYTGTEAELQRGLLFAADSGSYIYTGTVADLIFTPIGEFFLDANTGTYTYLGTDINFVQGFALDAESGTYNYIGTDAALERTLLFAADTGTYTYTGTDVELQSGLILAANSGTYTYTGTVVELQRGLVVTADSGTYTYTGTDVEFLLDFTLDAETGTYTYSGTDVGLFAGFLLDAESGTYVYTGADSTLVFNPSGDFTLTAGSGTYTYTGQDIGLLVGSVLDAESGTYTYTGTDIGLFPAFILDAATGTYTYTGTSIDFSQTRILDAESGTYSYTGTDVRLIIPFPTDVTFGVEAIISDRGQGVEGLITDTGQGVIASIGDGTGVQALINQTGLGVFGIIDDTGQGVIASIA